MGASNYTYDNDGNTVTDAQGRSYTWDFENRLVQAVNPGVGTTTFRYDPFGRRIQKSGPLGTTIYLYDGMNVPEEVDDGGNVVARYARTKRGAGPGLPPHVPSRNWLPQPSWCCKVPGHPLHFVPTHPLQWRRGTGPRNPALDDFRALDSGVQFANQSGAVEHQHALFHSYHLHPLSGQRLVDRPLPSFDIQFALAIHFQYPRPSGIFPARRMRIVAVKTGLPQCRRSSHT